MKFPARSFFLLSQRLAIVLVAFLCSAMGASAWADPPGRVGRVGDVSGQVWLYSPDAGEWITAVRNRPLTTGDRVATDTDARAELRIGSSSVRLNSGTELEVLAIDDDHISLQLHNGSVAARLRSAESAREFELRTAEGRFLTHRPGRYRFDHGEDTSNVTVWSGEALYEGPGSALTVNDGQRAEFWLDRNNAAQYSVTDPMQDDFAAWSNDRDRGDERSTSTRYVSPEMTGAEDLDRYGRWQDTPDYGAVWVPQQVPMGWAPYSNGHWAWVSPWGWTWVDDAPWGFAPFHYGRWAMWRNSWCWVPGTYVRRPVYAPALVGWVGGSHFSLAISVGGSPAPAVGWFPLAPREVFVPTYRVSPRYVQQVNVTHVTNITNITTIVNNPQQAVTNIDYRNRRIPHALTVVPQTVMVNRQAVAPAAAQVRNTPVVQQLVSQPGRNVMVSAPHVAAPAITPGIAQARRIPLRDMQGRDGERGRPAAPQATTQAPAAPLVVPPSPVRQAAIARPSDPERARVMQERERRQEGRPEARGQVSTPAAPVVRAAPAAPPVPAPAPRAAEEARVHAPPPTRVPPPPSRPQPAPTAAAPAVTAAPPQPERNAPPPTVRGTPVPSHAQREAEQRARQAQAEAEQRARVPQHEAPPPPVARARAEAAPPPPPPIHRPPQAEPRPVQAQPRAPQEPPQPPPVVQRNEQHASAPGGRGRGREEQQQAREEQERRRGDQRER